MWQQRIAGIRANGMAAIAEADAVAMVTEGFRHAAPDVVATFTAMVAGCLRRVRRMCRGLRDTDLREDVRKIGPRPTLVITGARIPPRLQPKARSSASGFPAPVASSSRRHNLSNVEAPTDSPPASSIFLAT